MPAKDNKFTLRISTIDESTSMETLALEIKNNDIKQLIEMEEGLMQLFGGILQKQKRA